MNIVYFLNKIRRNKSSVVIFFSGVFAGSVKAVKAYVSGDGFGIPKVLDYPVTLRAFQRTFSSMPYILPDSRFWTNDEVRDTQIRGFCFQ